MNNTQILPRERKLWVGLSIAALALAGIAIWILLLSKRFDYYSETEQRPILTFLIAMTIGFVAYVFGTFFASKVRQTRRLGIFVVGVAILLRLILLFSTPIQEVDIYRYLWDGVVASKGVSPFQYSPSEVATAVPQMAGDRELKALVDTVEADAGINEALSRIHFSELPTIYPSTSQWVFRAAAHTTPGHSSIGARVRIMKAWLLAFDIGTLLLVIALLSLCEKPIGLSTAYGWCPLVLKEIANSGHLDSIAVFLSCLTIYVLFITIKGAIDNPTGRYGSWPALILLSLIFSAAAGAKIYPVILAPLVLFAFVRNFGWVKAITSSLVFIAATAILLSPMFTKQNLNEQQIEAGQGSNQPLPKILVPQNISPGTQPSDGIETFFKYWEMNDLIFMILVENLKPIDQKLPVWFSILPQSWRTNIVTPITNLCSLSLPEAPFLITRGLTGLIFLWITMALAFRAAKKNGLADYGEAAFLTIAWFWLLSPTQNTWYWMWALPFLPFVRNRAWYAVSGLVAVYYLRFWLNYHADLTVAGTPYAGTQFFDFVVVWLEFGPWFAWLAVESVWRRQVSPKRPRLGQLPPNSL